MGGDFTKLFEDSTLKEYSMEPGSLVDAMEESGFDRDRIEMMRVAVAGASETVSRLFGGELSPEDASRSISGATGLDEKGLRDLLRSILDAGSDRGSRPEASVVSFFRNDKNTGVMEDLFSRMVEAGMPLFASDDEALSWLEDRSGFGDSDATTLLGFMLLNGIGVPQSEERAVSLYNAAAAEGNTKAQTYLGMMYNQGAGVEQSPEKAAIWYEKAARAGEAEAQLFLAAKYYSGDGVPFSYEEAFRWYSSAAQKGLTEAQIALGIMYMKGYGTRRSDDEAATWFNLAAEKGSPEAQRTFADFY
ncbi:MAG: sel1 repeat family protein [Candidatus Methanomethylophilaceae archaeon]|nr:sel1 repeat family protein [Candidatus Methanomethylophilaceae archaeon]